jgi:hypothetical protein
MSLSRRLCGVTLRNPAKMSWRARRRPMFLKLNSPHRPFPCLGFAVHLAMPNAKLRAKVDRQALPSENFVFSASRQSTPALLLMISHKLSPIVRTFLTWDYTKAEQHCRRGSRHKCSRKTQVVRVRMRNVRVVHHEYAKVNMESRQKLAEPSRTHSRRRPYAHSQDH